MPRKATVRKARKDQRKGKAPTTQAGHFVKEEMDDVKKGKTKVKSRKQAIAIGLSKARQAGVALKDSRKKTKAKKKTTAKKSTARKSSRKSSTHVLPKSA